MTLISSRKSTPSFCRTPEQESVRQPKGCARLHGCKYPRVQLCLSSAHHKLCYQLHLIAWHNQRSLGALKQLLGIYVHMGLF